jgi:small subunit ribosomal protein S27Ae
VKHKSSKQWEILKVKGDKINRLKKVCPRCGLGTYMAGHKEKDGKIRYYCGKCHMTEWGKS